MGATDKLLGSDRMRVGPDGSASIALRLPWYRSLAPSTIEDLAITIDGVPVARESLQVEINGRADDLEALAQRWQETWFVQDTAAVRFPYIADERETFQAAVSLTIRIPYILTGPDAAMTRTVREERALSVAKQEERP